MRFPEFTGEWVRKRIGDDCSILMCKRIFANQTAESGDVPFYKIGTIGEKADAYITKALYEEYKHKYNFPQKGEVLISCAGTVGKTIIYDGEPAYYQDSNIVWLSNPKHLYLNEFLRYVLIRVDWSKLNTTTIVRIYNNNLRELRINYPCLKEQQKIVNLLRLLDKRISTQNRVIDKLESLIKGIVVTHFNNVLNKQTITIANLGESYSVGNLSKEDLTTTGEPCILYGELFTTYGCVAHNISSKTKNFEQATLSQKGDLLFPASTTVDAVSLISPTTIQTSGVYVAGDMFGIHIARQYNSEYISYLLNYVYNGKLAKYAQGSTIIHLHYNDIKTATIQVPTLAEQNKCSLLLELFQKKLTAERSLLNMYQVQKNYLLQNMFI